MSHLAILGAGPTGLEAALAAVDAGHPFTVYEAGDQVATYLRDWGHVRLFSSWELDISPRMRRHLEAAGKPVPGSAACPTGAEVQAVLRQVAALPAIAPHVELGHNVLQVGREGLLKHQAIGTDERASRPFRLLVRDAHGNERIAHATHVLDCTGTYDHPNATGDGGIAAPGEYGLDGAISRHIPDVLGDVEAWAGKRIALIGAGHSAKTAACDLAELVRRHPDTRVTWTLRRLEAVWQTIPDDPLPERSALIERTQTIAQSPPPGFEVRTGRVAESFSTNVTGSGTGVTIVLRTADGGSETLEVDHIVSLTGFVGDHSLYRQLQVHECYATSGPMKLAAALLGSSSVDCMAQTTHGADTLTNPEPGFFILGSKSYGRNTTFLMRVGWQQVAEVFGTLDGSR